MFRGQVKVFNQPRLSAEMRSSRRLVVPIDSFQFARQLAPRLCMPRDRADALLVRSPIVSAQVCTALAA
jgi:hypothetical protein